MSDFQQLLRSRDTLATAIASATRQNGLTVVPPAIQLIVAELAATRAALAETQAQLAKLKFDLLDWEIDIYGWRVEPSDPKR